MVTIDLTYILAASHSGSTLLALLLGSHPEAVTVGELAPGGIGNVAEYRCSCGVLFLECPFWKRVAEGMSRRGTDFGLTNFHTRFQSTSGRVAKRLLRPLHRGPVLEALRDSALAVCPSRRGEWPILRRNYQVLAEVIIELTGRRRIIDSSKGAVQLKYLLRNPELRIKVVRLIRDGRGVAVTHTDPSNFADAQSPSLRGGGSGAHRNGERRSMTEAAHEWRRSNEEAERLLALLPAWQKIEVRYEALSTNPQDELNRIFRFLELDPVKVVRDFRSLEHHVVGNGMRLDTTSEIRLDERWKSAFTARDLEDFEAVAGKMNRRYGYV